MAGNGSRAGSGRSSGAASKSGGTGSVQAGARMVEIRRNVNSRVSNEILGPQPKFDRRTKSGRAAEAQFDAGRKRMLTGAGAVINKNVPPTDRRGSGNRAGRRLLEMRSGASNLRFGSRMNSRRNESGLSGSPSMRQLRRRAAGTMAR